MTSISLSPPIANLDVFTDNGPPRHARRHSRNPTGALPLPHFTFNPESGLDGKDVTRTEEEVSRLDAEQMDNVRRPSKPAPLPAFKFNPGANIPVDRSPSPTHPVLEEMALNQQRVSRSARPAPLPVFTFNPDMPSGQPSPTKTDGEFDNLKASGHKRGGSEFVGGGPDKPKVVTTSPTKHETKPSGPPVSHSGLRGHSHRRSQAVSISDIDTSDLIKQHAIAKARAPSLPTTPNDTQLSFPRASPGQRFSVPNVSRSPPASPRRGGSISGFRPRVVDFSDQVDVIPRPLSMISSETERSYSTVRGHSVTNSINSIASPTLASPLELSEDISPDIFETASRRPNSADAALLLSNASGFEKETLLGMPKRPLSACGSPKVASNGSPPTKKKHFWSSPETDASPSPTPKQERLNPFEEQMQAVSVPMDVQAPPKIALERPANQKRRKYHTWTAGIFSKKLKNRASKAKPRRSPTPPSLFRRDSDNVNEIFDSDHTVVLREDSPVGTRKQAPINSLLSTALPPAFGADLPSAELDIDAAMGFADVSRHSEDHSRSTISKIAKLHSSERRNVVDAFGVTHRRTESAPTMSPMNRSGLTNMARHGSNTSLCEEVFDEEEEDNFLAHEKDNTPDTSRPPTIVASETVEIHPIIEGGLCLANVSSHVDDVVIVDPDTVTHAEDMRSSKSTIEAPVLTAEELPKRPATSPMSFAYPDPQTHYASSTEGRTTSGSLLSSPDADFTSFENQSRPRRFGDFSTDNIRPSTDDLPSLSDSVSTGIAPRGSSAGNARPSLEQRSNSMFVAGSFKSNEGWKRSSLASLNRLIPGSSHGSKLKFESVANPNEEKAKKKGNRISKLMRFWRSKELEGNIGAT